MNDPTQAELDRILDQRARIFTPGWFRDLIAARLGFGDTFWLGGYGILLALVPLVVLISGLIYAQAPEGVTPFLRGVVGVFGLWRIVILQALLRRGPRGVWPVIGILWLLGEALACFGYAFGG